MELEMYVMLVMLLLLGVLCTFDCMLCLLRELFDFGSKVCSDWVCCRPNCEIYGQGNIGAIQQFECRLVCRSACCGVNREFYVRQLGSPLIWLLREE